MSVDATAQPTLLIPNFLYLGSEFNAADRELLIECNISAIIDLYDATQEDLIKHIAAYNLFLDEAERQGRVVLVHCKSGNSRAAALCVAHLMHRHRWPLAKAFAFVKMKRPAAQPNAGFLEQLAIYQEHLEEEDDEDEDEEEEEEEEEEKDEDEEDAMELELARRRAALMRKRGLGEDDDEDESEEDEGEEYMDLDEEADKGKEKLIGHEADKPANMDQEDEKEKPRQEERERDDLKEKEEESERRARAARDWMRWFAKPPALVDIVLGQQKSALANCVRDLFAADEWEDLRRLHEALQDTPQFVNILRGAYFAATKAHAIATASAIAAQPQARAFRGGATSIDSVMEWRRAQQKRLESTFGTSPRAGFQRAFEQTLPYFLNPLAKVIVTHLDSTLRNADERNSKDVEDELLALLEGTLPYMGKSAAAFEFHYANALASRLLAVGPGQNHKFHTERRAGQLLGRFFGGFAALVEAMIADAQFSFEMEEMQKSLTKEKVRRGEESGPLVSVRVLAADLWPQRRMLLASATKDSITEADMRSWRGAPLSSWPKSYVLPGRVQQKWDAFAAAYLAENPQKRIQYLPHMGTAEVQVVLGESRFFFTVTTAMMCVLHRFSFGHQFSLRELHEETGIPDKELKRTVFSLISPMQGSRTGLLIKNPPKGKMEPSDVFSVNASFTSRLRKIRVPALPFPPRKPRGIASKD